MSPEQKNRTIAEGWNEFQGLLLDKIEAIESSGGETRDILDQTRLKLEGDVMEIKTIQKQQSENIEKLLQIVRDGNGKTPLVLRMEIAERNIVALEKYKEQGETSQSELSKAKRNSMLSLLVALFLFILNIGWELSKNANSKQPEVATQSQAQEVRNQKTP